MEADTYIKITSSSSTQIYLTPYFSTDAPALQALLSLPRVSRPIIAIPEPYTLSRAQEWITLQLGGTSNLPLQVLRAGSPSSVGKLVGSAGLMPASSEEIGAGEIAWGIGYYLHPDWQKLGIMRNAVEALLEVGRKRGMTEACLEILEDNWPSRNVVEGRAGWERDEKRDEVVEWPESKGGGQRKLLAYRWKAS